MITSVHWAAALFLATLFHMVALAWLHQPRARIDPADVDSGIVISLQTSAARQRPSIDVIAEPDETGADIRDHTAAPLDPDTAQLETRDVAPVESTAPVAPLFPRADVETGPEPAVSAPPIEYAQPDAAVVAETGPPPSALADDTKTVMPQAATVAGPVPVAPASVDVEAPGNEPVLPATVQLPATQPVEIRTPEDATSPEVLESRDVPIPVLAPDHTDVAILGAEPVPPAALPPEPEPGATQELPPEPDVRSRTVLLDLEAVQPEPEDRGAVTAAEELRPLPIPPSERESVRALVEQPSAEAPPAIAPTQSLAPVEVVTAKAVPATPVQSRARQDVAGVTAQYAGLLKGWLKRHMHYPRQAWLDGSQGTAIVRFSIDRSGAVLSARLERGSGHAVLDEEVLQMVRRADPFPPIPEDILGRELAIRVPVRFHIAEYGRTRHIPPIELQ